MKNHVLIMILSALTTFSATAMDVGGLDVKFGGNAYVRGYNNVDTTNGGHTKTQGFAQLLRVKMDFTTKNHIRVSTRTTLSGDRWNGDPAVNAPTGTNADNDSANTNGGNPVRLDYGFIEVPFKNGWVARAGRQTANFSDCFNTCDDRRDRLMLMKAYGNYVPVILYDKRREGDQKKSNQDSDMYAAALFHIHQVHEWALLYAYFDNGTTNFQLNKVHNFSPYYKYKGTNFKALAVWNWLGGGSKNSWYHGMNANSFALKGEYVINGHFDVGFQTVQAFNGGLIAGGYDTFSFVVNNSPEYNQSNSKLVSIGGLGSLTGGNKDDESLYIGRVRYMQQKFTGSLAVGKAKTYNNFATGNKVANLMIYDMQLNYQYTKSTSFKAGYALVRDDKKLSAALFQVSTHF